MKVTIEIADEDVRGVLERFNQLGPSWCTHVFQSDSLWSAHIITQTEVLTERLDLERGLRMMLTRGVPGYHVSPGNIAPRDWGPRQCDAFVQYAAFGEIRYV